MESSELEFPHLIGGCGRRVRLLEADFQWVYTVFNFHGLAPRGAYRFSKFLARRLIEQGRLSKLIKI